MAGPSSFEGLTMPIDTVTLSTAWINQPALGQRPARTLLVGAATPTLRYRFGTLAFDLTAHSSTVTDDPAETMRWLADQLHVPPARLLLWWAEDTVVPSLIAAAETGATQWRRAAAARTRPDAHRRGRRRVGQLWRIHGHLLRRGSAWGGPTVRADDSHRTGRGASARQPRRNPRTPRGARKGDVAAVAEQTRGYRVADRSDRGVDRDPGRGGTAVIVIHGKPHVRPCRSISLRGMRTKSGSPPFRNSTRG